MLVQTDCGKYTKPSLPINQKGSEVEKDGCGSEKIFLADKWGLASHFNILEGSLQHSQPLHFTGVYKDHYLEIQPTVNQSQLQ